MLFHSVRAWFDRFYQSQFALSAVILLVVNPAKTHSEEPFRIRVVDNQNGWPVPLVELATTHHQRFISDNDGIVAIDSPELLGHDIWFSVAGHGYSVPEDGFGYRGIRLHPVPGESYELQVTRKLPAKRLGRVTGGGIFAESQKFGDRTDWIEQGVFGCDSVQSVVHRGRRFWLWGDTTLPTYPLGRFHSTGATTDIHPIRRAQPPVTLRYDYFADQNATPRNIAKMPGQGPTWITALASIPDATGSDKLVATYSKIKPPLEEYEVGLCVWNHEKESFEPLSTIWKASSDSTEKPPAPRGHSAIWTDDSGIKWLLFGDPFPTLRCRADFASWSNPNTWEPIAPQETVATGADAEVRTVRPHRGAIAFDASKNRWITVFTQLGGKTSYIGNLWFAESDSPLGPWRDAIQIVEHENYSFYNPKIHIDLVPNGRGILLFEATFTRTFSKTSQPTPRHDYNQILYRLDLDEL